MLHALVVRSKTTLQDTEPQEVPCLLKKSSNNYFLLEASSAAKLFHQSATTICTKANFFQLTSGK
jgi:hypothetical protein